MAESDRCHPLVPMLATSLLDFELDKQSTVSTSCMWSTGVKGIDSVLPGDLWSSRKVIGVAMSADCPSLIKHIIATHLISLGSARNIVTGRPAAFIISPYNSSVVSDIDDVLTKQIATASRLGSKKEGLSSLELLDHVQLLQYFDFVGLTESLSEASSRLYEMSIDPPTRSATSTDQGIALYIDGLSATTESTLRRGGLVQANALLASLLRSVIHISRTYPSVLVILGVEVKREMKVEDEIRSAFSNATGTGLRFVPGGALGRTLESGLDVLVLVHDANDTVESRQKLVEVVKDRVGASLGAWVAWNMM